MLRNENTSVIQRAHRIRSGVFRIFGYTIFALLLNSCSQDPLNNPSQTHHVQPDTSLIKKNSSQVQNDSSSTEAIPIDSVRMHAFENIYFGQKHEATSRLDSYFELFGRQYFTASSSTHPKIGLTNFILTSCCGFQTQKRTIREINELTNAIKIKHGKGRGLNKTIFVKHFEEKSSPGYGEWGPFFPRKSEYTSEKDRIGKPHRFIAHLWETPFKTIELGYYYSEGSDECCSSPVSASAFVIYISFKSRILEPPTRVVNNQADEADKF